MSTTRRNAFTLIELLVVVSIIALLIGILLPTLGEARRQAGLAACMSNNRQLSQGVAVGVNENADIFPNAPEGGLNIENYGNDGVVGLPATRYAYQQRPINGWAGQSSPNTSPSDGWKFTTDGLGFYSNGRYNFHNVGLEGFWFIAFGNIITDARGYGMLTEPFVSPVDRIWKSFWERYQEESATATHQQALAWSSYWYVLPTHYNRKVFRHDGPMNPTTPGGGGPNILPHRAFTRATQVQFPSQKVLFFQQQASHDRNYSVWSQPGATITVSLTDGSARTTVPARDTPPGDPSNADDMTEEFGPFSPLLGGVALNYILADGSGPIGVEAYRTTVGGLAGRDFR